MFLHTKSMWQQKIYFYAWVCKFVSENCKINPCWKWNSGSPQSNETKPNSQAPSVYMYQKHLGGSLLILVPFLCFVTTFFGRLEWKKCKWLQENLVDLYIRFVILLVGSMQQNLIAQTKNIIWDQTFQQWLLFLSINCWLPSPPLHKPQIPNFKQF